MTITVAMPFYGAPELLERAVKSVLRQTVRDLVLVVYGDGERPRLDGIKDDRLIIHASSHNRGNYFARQAMLLAEPFGWYAPHDADDWTEPHHLESLLALNHEAVCVGMVYFHNGSSRVVLHRGRYHVGLFRSDRLRSFGGYNPAERIGQDSTLLHLLRLTGPTVDCMTPTYHRVRRPGTLTTRPETNHRSIARQDVKRRNRKVYMRATELGDVAEIRRWRERLVPPEVTEALAREVEALGRLLGQRVAA